MKHPILGLTILAGTAALVIYFAKKAKEERAAQAKADAALAKKAVNEALQNDSDKNEKAN